MTTEDVSGFSLDSLLNDLDEAVKFSPKRFNNNNIDMTAPTTKFIPHPPALSQSQNPNPKTKFAVVVDRNNNSRIESPIHESNCYSNNSTNSSFSPIKPSLVNNENIKIDKDENSLDSLLNLLNSPQHNNNNNNNNNTNNNNNNNNNNNTTTTNNNNNPNNHNNNPNNNYLSNSNSTKTAFFKPNNNNSNSFQNFPIICANMDTTTITTIPIQFNFDSVKESEKVFASLGFSTSLECLNNTTNNNTNNVMKSTTSPHNNNKNNILNNTNTNNRNISNNNNSNIVEFEVKSNISSPFDSPSSTESRKNHRTISYISNIDDNNNSLNNNNITNNYYNNSNNSQILKRIITNNNNNNNSSHSDGNIITPRISIPPNKQQQVQAHNTNNSNNNTYNTNTTYNNSTVVPIAIFQEINTKKNTAIIDDQKFLPAKIGSTSLNNHIDNNKINNSNINKARCIKVVIADSAMERGRKTSSFTRYACDNLRCIKCNFKVHCFLNNSWKDSVDYMFLRNTVPNEQKLSLMLVHDTTTTIIDTNNCAYCCQCTSITIKENNEIELNPTNSTGPQWVCAGH